MQKKTAKLIEKKNELFIIVIYSDIGLSNSFIEIVNIFYLYSHKKTLTVLLTRIVYLFF